MLKAVYEGPKLLAICRSEQCREILRLKLNQQKNTWMNPSSIDLCLRHDYSRFFCNRGVSNHTKYQNLSNQQQQQPFNITQYFSLLEDTQLGNILLYSHTLPSTQLLLVHYFSDIQCGLMCVCDNQTRGVGRRSHEWMSPDGCLSFSFKTFIHQARDLTMIPYLVSVVLCEVLNDKHDIGIRIKWPNDIYWNNIKVGGILCHSTFNSKYFDVTVGCGLNVDNAYPTTCIKNILSKEDFSLERHDILASFSNRFPRAMQLFRLHGFIPFRKEYYKYWLHSNQFAILQMPNSGGEKRFKQVKIVGVNVFNGMLEVIDPKTEEPILLFPESYSMEYAQNLIHLVD